MSAYIASLKKMMPAPDAAEQPATIHQRFVDWHASLPAFTRDRAFAMSEFEQALGTQGKYISPVLLALGWRRRRVWSTGGQYCRYWEPPT